jgi:hypothetical protein
MHRRASRENTEGIFFGQAGLWQFRKNKKKRREINVLQIVSAISEPISIPIKIIQDKNTCNVLWDQDLITLSSQETSFGMV